MTDDKALRYNEWKLQWHLLHIPFIEWVIKVLEFGAEKYSPDNWKKPMDRNTVLDSQMRHQAALMKGEEIDSDSGLPHIYHLACNAMFYSYHMLESPPTEVWWTAINK